MTFLVHSDDYKSGNSSDGVWDLGRNLNGTWQVTAQTMDAQSFPWMWAGQDQMVLRIHNPDDLDIHATFGLTFNSSLGFITDLNVVATTIQNAMQAKIDEVAGEPMQSWAARTVTVTYDSSNRRLVFVIEDNPIDVLWHYDDPETPSRVSSINPSFNLNSATEDQNNVSTFYVSTVKMVTDPQYLFVYITESTSSILTTSQSLPTLMFSTKDSQFTGQVMTIRETTTTLTIKICKMHESVAIPLTNSWYLVFKKIG